MKKRPWYLPRIRRGLAEPRRYPVFSIVILLLVLIIPAAFANLIAPHHPTKDGDVGRRLLPPAWVSAETTVKTVVERVSPSNRANEISLEDAQTAYPNRFNGELATPARRWIRRTSGRGRPVQRG